MLIYAMASIETDAMDHVSQLVAALLMNLVRSIASIDGLIHAQG